MVPKTEMGLSGQVNNLQSFVAYNRCLLLATVAEKGVTMAYAKSRRTALTTDWWAVGVHVPRTCTDDEKSE